VWRSGNRQTNTHRHIHRSDAERNTDIRFCWGRVNNQYQSLRKQTVQDLIHNNTCLRDLIMLLCYYCCILGYSKTVNRTYFRKRWNDAHERNYLLSSGVLETGRLELQSTAIEHRNPRQRVFSDATQCNFMDFGTNRDYLPIQH